jgi:P-type Ca2+ transporter type 2C
MKRYQGLTSKAVEHLRNQFGYNEIKDIGRDSAFTIFLRQIRKNFIIYLLLAAMALSFLVGKDITAYTILGVVLVVIFSGFIQEYKAEKAIEALKSMIMPVCIAIRDSVATEVPSRELVPGDIIILGSGERIPADAVLLEANELRVDESILTGESVEVKKDATKIGDDSNQLLMGSYVVNGRAVAKVTHIGMSTHFGKIAAMISGAEKEMPLQSKINKISKYMVVVAIVMSALTSLIMFLRADFLDYVLITDILVLAIALAVSAFPEGFPVVLTTTLATGVARMAKNNAIVNRMSIIETLGETTVICSDKTGTITKGEMTANTVYLNGDHYDITGAGYIGDGEFLLGGKKVNPQADYAFSIFLKVASVCNDSRIQRTGEDGHYKVLGTPTEGALLVLAAKAGVFAEDFEGKRVSEVPFSSERKLMSVMIKEAGKNMVLAKGAPEVLLEKCVKIYSGGKIIDLTKKEKDHIVNANRSMTSKALRTLALAYKFQSTDAKYSEDHFIFLGLVGMEDPPRENLTQAVSDCRSAGIDVKMITGDNKETADSIAKQINLEGKIMVGTELDELSDEELKAVVKSIAIFARVRPHHKLRIVRALKSLNEVVTMTGDGVNDAPALKEAHIGVAMGISGTDVSRSVSDLILKDDNFATIVLAVKEGRTIFNNIRKFVSYQLSCNFAELYMIFIGLLLAPVLGWATPLLLALHILFMNLVTDNLPAITLGLNPYSKDVMEDPPRRGAQILSSNLFGIVAFNGILMGSMALAVYYISFNILGQSMEVARTTALVCLIVLEIASAFNFRSFRHHALTRSPFINPYLVVASILSFGATLLIIYFEPARRIFETTVISAWQWIIPVIAGILILVVFDIIKVYSKATGTLFVKAMK